jgi:hypothetical protein
VRVFPNLQLWDYVARHLQDEARAAPIGSDRAGLLNDFARRIKNSLDAEVPEYKEAREGASRFFGAENALEAGQKFLTSDLNQAKLGYQKFSPAEKSLFAEGFTSSLVDRIQKIADNRLYLRCCCMPCKV